MASHPRINSPFKVRFTPFLPRRDCLGPERTPYRGPDTLWTYANPDLPTAFLLGLMIGRIGYPMKARIPYRGNRFHSLDNLGDSNKSSSNRTSVRFSVGPGRIVPKLCRPGTTHPCYRYVRSG